MNGSWQVRPYEPIAVVQDVLNPHPRARLIEVGDEVCLHWTDGELAEEVHVRVTEVVGDDGIRGVISRANRTGAGGEAELVKGAPVTFDERHAFTLKKA